MPNNAQKARAAINRIQARVTLVCAYCRSPEVDPTSRTCSSCQTTMPDARPLPQQTPAPDPI